MKYKSSSLVNYFAQVTGYRIHLLRGTLQGLGVGWILSVPDSILLSEPDHFPDLFPPVDPNLLYTTKYLNPGDHHYFLTNSQFEELLEHAQTYLTLYDLGWSYGILGDPDTDLDKTEYFWMPLEEFTPGLDLGFMPVFHMARDSHLDEKLLTLLARCKVPRSRVKIGAWRFGFVSLPDVCGVSQ